VPGVVKSFLIQAKPLPQPIARCIRKGNAAVMRAPSWRLADDKQPGRGAELNDGPRRAGQKISTIRAGSDFPDQPFGRL
jgi:hypothetical protein